MAENLNGDVDPEVVFVCDICDKVILALDRNEAECYK